MLFYGLGGDGGAGAEDVEQLVHLVVHTAEVGAYEIGKHGESLGLNVDAAGLDVRLDRILEFPLGHGSRCKDNGLL